MVTAILPSIIAPGKCQDEAISRAKMPAPSYSHGISPSISSELTITPQRLQHQLGSNMRTLETSPTRLAGVVGLFTGCGALLALGLFLRLPDILQRMGIESGQALAYSYYAVAALSLVVAAFCFLGLRHLQGEEGKGWRFLVYGGAMEPSSGAHSGLWSLKALFESIILGFRNPLLGLGYLGGFVARASSVAISLFIPLFVNAYYISSGRCDEDGRNPQDIKDHCRGAYVLAAELTGVSQLVALLFAPVFGFLADKYRRFNIPLLTAALLGIAAYIGLASLANPRSSGYGGSPVIYAIMALLGISQIGAIVCSLGLLGRAVLGLEINVNLPEASISDAHTPTEAIITSNNDAYQSVNRPSEGTREEATEGTLLLPTKAHSRDHLKGSIAGVYSLAGGAGILLLTKVGGLMFDKVSHVAPFVMMSVFNFVLLVAGLGIGISAAWNGT